MKLSARNQISGVVTAVETGAVNGIVHLDADGVEITGTISMSSIDALGLQPGIKAVAIVKATDVMIGLGTMKISARNQIAGKITGIESGSVNGIVTVTNGSFEISATISNASIASLELETGKDVTAVIKATSVMFGVE